MIERIFLLIILVCFSIPTNNNLFVPLPGVQLKISEFAMILLPLLNFLCKKKTNITSISSKSLIKIYLIIFIVLITEVVIKKIVFDVSVLDIFKGLRAGLTFFCFLFFIKDGLSFNIVKVWKVLCISVVISFFLSILIPFLGLEFLVYSEEDGALGFSGRIANANASFGIIGIYLLFWDKDRWYNKGLLVKIAIWCSIIGLILTFNRTYLGLSVLFVLYSLWKTVSPKVFVKFIFLSVIFVLFVNFLYITFEPIRSQLDRRVLSLFETESSFSKVTLENDRVFIYEDISERIQDGYWVIGMPFNEPIFVRKAVRTYDVDTEMFTTDVSFVNILLRYGLLPTLLFAALLYSLYKQYRLTMFSTILLIFFVASFNIDTLFKHNSLFFLIVIFFLIHYDKKNSILSKN